ncbi:MAG: SOS response-associated peptidase [Candidatus Thiodiazotropha sp. (ex Notomyrtea botanica)]|nr:SOS response-associated peptidase [Candidatus Thiodiazotropha sp. (ex Notomyrtea botanica)]
MCGRFYLDVKQEKLNEYFGLQSAPSIKPRYNIAPSHEILAIRSVAQNRECSFFRWGLIPFWSKDEKIGYKTINARAETVDSKPAYRAAFKYHRCLIPASGFYEWKTVDGGKQPYCLRPSKESLFAFAGLYERWDDKAGKEIDTCTIIVGEANRDISPIRDRMPIIIDPADFNAWLDPDTHDATILKPLLKPWREGEIEYHQVSMKVNSPKNDCADLILPIST